MGRKKAQQKDGSGSGKRARAGKQLFEGGVAERGGDEAEKVEVKGGRGLIMLSDMAIGPALFSHTVFCSCPFFRPLSIISSVQQGVSSSSANRHTPHIYLTQSAVLSTLPLL